MAIRSDTFGGVELTGEDAAAFERQVEQTKPSEEAIRALARGDELLAKFSREARKRD